MHAHTRTRTRAHDWHASQGSRLVPTKQSRADMAHSPPTMRTRCSTPHTCSLPHAAWHMLRAGRRMPRAARLRRLASLLQQGVLERPPTGQRGRSSTPSTPRASGQRAVLKPRVQRGEVERVQAEPEAHLGHPCVVDREARLGLLAEPRRRRCPARRRTDPLSRLPQTIGRRGGWP